MEQRSKEWFEARKGRVTASSIGAIMGLAPYRTRDDVLRSMVREHFGASSEFEGNIATDYGTRNEEAALWQYELENGVTVDAGDGFYTIGDSLGASPDGLIGSRGLLEIKCPFGLRDKPAPVPFKGINDQMHYYAQMQMQMHVVEREWCDFYQWSPVDSSLERVAYSENYWQGEISPAIIDFQFDLEAAIANPDEHLEPLRKEINTQHTKKLVTEYHELQDAIEQATERKKDVLAELIKLSGDKNALIHGHKLTLVERKGSVSYARLVKKLLPDADLEPYRGKPSASWRLS